MVAHSTVTIRHGICPECGRTYVAGGTTRTSFTAKQQTQDTADFGVGENVNIFA